jgi:hypothetical protein
MEWAERRYAIVTAPGARIHDYVPLKTFVREECISVISAAYKKDVIDGKRLRSAKCRLNASAFIASPMVGGRRYWSDDRFSEHLHCELCSILIPP